MTPSSPPPAANQQGYTVLQQSDPVLADSPRRAFAEEVLIGLSETPKRLPSKYFYDDAGSRLFQAITELDEYYPTRCEFEIFRDHRGDLLDRFRRAPFNLIDLGAGDGRKTAVLLEYLVAHGADVRYVPIDISEEAMRIVVDAMGARFPTLHISGLVADYFDGLRWLSHQTDRRNLVLFLGSNIGNFNTPRARAFLRRLWNALNPADRVLIGFDLKKDIEALLAAYNDRQGVTARFNLNLLTRINRELGGDFDLSTFEHQAIWNAAESRMEMHLVSRKDQVVHVAGHAYRFAAGETIHTENSYKFTLARFSDLAASAGWRVEAQWISEDPAFGIVLLRN